jgi:hypothetical protein
MLTLFLLISKNNENKFLKLNYLKTENPRKIKFIIYIKFYINYLVKNCDTFFCKQDILQTFLEFKTIKYAYMFRFLQNDNIN